MQMQTIRMELVAATAKGPGSIVIEAKAMVAGNPVIRVEVGFKSNSELYATEGFTLRVLLDGKPVEVDADKVRLALPDTFGHLSVRGCRRVVETAYLERQQGAPDAP